MNILYIQRTKIMISFKMTHTLYKYMYIIFINICLALSPTEMVSNQKSPMVHMKPTRTKYCTISSCFHCLVTMTWSFLIRENITIRRDLCNFALSKPSANLHNFHLWVTVFFLNLICVLTIDDLPWLSY